MTKIKEAVDNHKNYEKFHMETIVAHNGVLVDIVVSASYEETKFDKDTVLPLVPERHQIKLNEHDTVYATGYRRTRHGEQQLELRFDGIAGCLRTPEGGSSKQYLVVKKNDEIHARLLTVREAARLMGAPDSFILPGSYNDGYKAMGDAVAMPVAQFIGENFLTKLAEAVYDD